jgi:hypothetical protein
LHRSPGHSVRLDSPPKITKSLGVHRTASRGRALRYRRRAVVRGHIRSILHTHCKGTPFCAVMAKLCSIYLTQQSGQLTVCSRSFEHLRILP